MLAPLVAALQATPTGGDGFVRGLLAFIILAVLIGFVASRRTKGPK